MPSNNKDTRKANEDKAAKATGGGKRPNARLLGTGTASKAAKAINRRHEMLKNI